MTTIFYARVSTVEQNPQHQAVQARAAGFAIDEVIIDHGVSGVTTKLIDRPEGKRLFDKLRRGDVLVVRWLDRLGRNYADVTDTVRHFMRQGVIVKTVINNLTFDGASTDPMQQAVRDALIAFMAATAAAQAEATKEAQRAGIEAAKGEPERYRGKKPSYTRVGLEQVQAMLLEGVGTSDIARAVGFTRQAVLRIRADQAGADAALRRWNA